MCIIVANFRCETTIIIFIIKEMLSSSLGRYRSIQSTLRDQVDQRKLFLSMEFESSPHVRPSTLDLYLLLAHSHCNVVHR